MHHSHRRWPVAALLVAMLMGTMLLGALPGVSAAAEPEECRNVRFGVVGFSDVAAVTAITSEVLARLGYAPASVNLPVPIIFASLQNRNIDVFLGNWMPAQEADSKPYLANGPSRWWVPTSKRPNSPWQCRSTSMTPA